MNDERSFTEEGSDVQAQAPDQISPFFNVLLEQFLSYVVAHADEIVQALLDLLAKKEDEDEVIFEQLKTNPSRQTLAAAVARVKAGGVSDEEIAKALLNEASF